MNHDISIQRATITSPPPQRDDDDAAYLREASDEPAEVRLAEGTSELSVEDVQEAWWSDDDDDEDTLRYVDLGGSD